VQVADGQAVTGIDIALAPMGGGGGNGSISGTVYNKKTNAPIAGAKVMASGCNRSATTGSDGTYTITGLADGSDTVRAMKSGYLCATYPTPVVITGGQAVTGIDFYLQITKNIAQD
jgi:threonine dehydratase